MESLCFFFACVFLIFFQSFFSFTNKFLLLDIFIFTCPCNKNYSNVKISMKFSYHSEIFSNFILSGFLIHISNTSLKFLLSFFFLLCRCTSNKILKSFTENLKCMQFFCIYIYYLFDLFVFRFSVKKIFFLLYAFLLH